MGGGLEGRCIIDCVEFNAACIIIRVTVAIGVYYVRGCCLHEMNLGSGGNSRRMALYTDSIKVNHWQWHIKAITYATLFVLYNQSTIIGQGCVM